MKKNIKNFCLILILLTLTACSSCNKGSTIVIGNVHDALNGAVNYTPNSNVKPSDSENLHTYNISLSNLEGHSIYAVASNQLVYHSRTSMVKFFDGSKSITTQGNEEDIEIKDKKEIISFIPDFTPAPLVENFLKEKSILNNSELNKSLIENNSTKRFYDAINKTDSINTHLRLRRTISKDTKSRVLNIWVENSIWDI